MTSKSSSVNDFSDSFRGDDVGDVWASNLGPVGPCVTVAPILPGWILPKLVERTSGLPCVPGSPRVDVLSVVDVLVAPVRRAPP